MKIFMLLELGKSSLRSASATFDGHRCDRFGGVSARGGPGFEPALQGTHPRVPAIAEPFGGLRRGRFIGTCAIQDDFPILRQVVALSPDVIERNRNRVRNPARVKPLGGG